VPVPADHRPPPAPPRTFRLLVVPGVTAGKWSRVWSQRLPEVALSLVPAEVAAQAAPLREALADAGLVRLPVDRTVFDAIPLYTEQTVVIVPRAHVVTAADDVTLADLTDETMLVPLDDVLAWTDAPDGWAAGHPADNPGARPATTAEAVELVAAGAGVLVVPQSLARLYHRRDLAYRVVTDAPTSAVALAWVRDRHTDLVEEMIGVVRGRTANSTRGRLPPPSPRERPSARHPARHPAHPSARRHGPNHAPPGAARAADPSGDP
jgi:DNA-binding transcriptional LysR family regulator